jgi:hypothetical protein
MKEDMKKIYELDDVIAEQNRMIVAEGGPKQISKAELKEIGEELSEIRQKTKAEARLIARLFPADESEDLLEM